MERKIFSLDNIKTALSPIFRKYGIKRAVIFGSYAKNIATEKSDVDLMVDSDLRGLHFAGLTESVREALGGKDVDILDKNHIEPNSKIFNEINRTGVLIYER